MTRALSARQQFSKELWRYGARNSTCDENFFSSNYANEGVTPVCWIGLGKVTSGVDTMLYCTLTVVVHMTLLSRHMEKDWLRPIYQSLFLKDVMLGWPLALVWLIKSSSIQEPESSVRCYRNTYNHSVY